jgi:protein-tyrosine kinase
VDSIRQAVELARAGQGVPPGSQGVPPGDAPTRAVQLNAAHLESTRIVAYETSGTEGHYYDMMRTQVLKEMDDNSWQFLTVTSGTAGCGKTVTACNLALSIARLAERSVLLVDMDLKKPKVAEYLGIRSNQGLLSILEGEATLAGAVIEARIGRSKLLVLPGEICKSGASEWMASQTMATLFQTIKREFRSRIVIFDMPPMLTGDEVISVLPQMEAVLLVAGIGSTSVSDIKECHKHLKTTPVVRVVVNRVAEATDAFYGYY